MIKMMDEADKDTRGNDGADSRAVTISLLSAMLLLRTSEVDEKVNEAKTLASPSKRRMARINQPFGF